MRLKGKTGGLEHGYHERASLNFIIENRLTMSRDNSGLGMGASLGMVSHRLFCPQKRLAKLVNQRKHRGFDNMADIYELHDTQKPLE